MQAFTITNIKNFMTQLFSTDAFDSYEFIEASVKMSFTYHIDGHINKDFFDTEEQETLPPLAHWKEGRPQVFHIIKGRRLPRSMKIILKLPDELQDMLLSQLPGSISRNDIEGCYLNILYEPTGLTCTTGISYRTFILDKSFEQLFDQYIQSILKAFF